MSIDVHAHCVPPSLLDVLRLDGEPLGITVEEDGRGASAVFAGRRVAGPIRADLMDMEHRLAAMDAAGVTTQLLGSWIDVTGYELEPEGGAAYCRLFNELLAEEAGRQPGRFRLLANVPLQSPELAAAELEYAVHELGAVGVEIASKVDGVLLGGTRFDTFWAKAEQLRCLVLLHPQQPLQGIELEPPQLHTIVGRPSETMLAVASLVLSGLFDRFPSVRICVALAGGSAPYLVGRMQRAHLVMGQSLTTDLSPTESIRRLYFDSMTHSPTALRYLIDLVGADHVLLGSDYPFPMGDPEPVTSVNAVPDLSDEERDLILSGNAERLIADVARTRG